MKSYRNTVAALLLTLMLSVAAHADGIMVTEKATPTPVPTVSGIMVTEATNDIANTGGIIHIDNAGSAPGAGDAMAQIALNLLQSVLTLF